MECYQNAMASLHSSGGAQKGAFGENGTRLQDGAHEMGVKERFG